MLRADAPIKTFADAFTTEIIVGGSGPGSTLYDYPVVLKNLIGAKVRLVAGYPGSREISLAAEKGEIHGTCGLNWSSAKLQYPNALKPGDQFRVVLQEAMQGHPELDKAGVPLVTQYSKKAEDKPVLDIVYGLGAINRVFFAPPEVPADRAAALRRAFMAMAADPRGQGGDREDAARRRGQRRRRGRSAGRAPLQDAARGRGAHEAGDDAGAVDGFQAR